MFNPYVLLIVTVVIYAGNILVGKVLTTEIPPFTVAFLRFSVALLFMIPLGWKDVKNHVPTWKKEWKPLIGMTLTGIILFNGLIYFSLAHTTSINAGIIEATTPIFSIMLGFLFLQERLSKSQSIGVAISLFGVGWVITKGSWTVLTNLSFNIGDLTMAIAMISWAVYSILVKKHNRKFPLYGGVLLMMFIGTLGLFPLFLLEWKTFVNINWSWSMMLRLVFVGIFPSVIALICWNKAVDEIGASRASVFLNLVPVVTAIGAILFLDETLGWLQAFGGIMVLLGVYMTSKAKKVSSKIPVAKEKAV